MVNSLSILIRVFYKKVKLRLFIKLIDINKTSKFSVVPINSLIIQHVRLCDAAMKLLEILPLMRIKRTLKHCK